MFIELVLLSVSVGFIASAFVYAGSKTRLQILSARVEDLILKNERLSQAKDNIERKHALVCEERDLYLKYKDLFNATKSNESQSKLTHEVYNEIKLWKKKYLALQSQKKLEDSERDKKSQEEIMHLKQQNKILSEKFGTMQAYKQQSFIDSANSYIISEQQNPLDEFKPIAYNDKFQMHYVNKSLFIKFLLENNFKKTYYESQHDYSFKLSNKNRFIERAHLRKGTCSKGVISLSNFHEFGNDELWKRYVRKGDTCVKVNEMTVRDFNIIARNYFNS